MAGALELVCVRAKPRLAEDHCSAGGDPKLARLLNAVLQPRARRSGGAGGCDLYRLIQYQCATTITAEHAEFAEKR